MRKKVLAMLLTATVFAANISWGGVLTRGEETAAVMEMTENTETESEGQTEVSEPESESPEGESEPGSEDLTGESEPESEGLTGESEPESEGLTGESEPESECSCVIKKHTRD